MKALKWGAIALCFVSLTACGQRKPVFTSEDFIKEPVVEETVVSSEFTLLYDGQELQCGTAWFAGEPYIHRDLPPELSVEDSNARQVSLWGQMYLSLEELCRELGYSILSDEASNTVYITSPWQIPEGYSVPVLMYHGVSDDMWGMTDLFVKPAEMEKQIVYLLENGYTPIWFEDLAHVDEIEKPVILTYDDGYVDNYIDLFPILQKYNVKATIFVVTGTVDNNKNSLTSDQIREMAASGLISFQSHTVTHPYLRGMSREDQEYELVQSKLALSRLTGTVPTVICYPSGSFDETTMELARQHYQMGINMNGNRYITGEDPYRVDRYYIARQDTLGTFIRCIQ